MTLGDNIARQPDAEREAGLRGSMLLALFLVALGAFFGAIGMIAALATGEAILFVFGAVFAGLSGTCLWFGVKRRKPARPLMIAYFSIALLAASSRLLSGDLDTHSPPYDAGLLMQWALDAYFLALLVFSERAKRTFTQ